MPRSVVPLPAPDLDPERDPGFVAAAVRAEDALLQTAPDAIGEPLARPHAHDIRIGTASWTDPTMVRAGVFYPRGVSSAEERLRYYAAQFSVVEVDATYYSLPDRAIAERWVERTPPGFTFHVKAHALMTGEPAQLAQLPRGLVEALPADVARRRTVYAKDLPPELDAAVWTRFMDALAPLSEAGRLGGILLQYPRWFIPSRENRALLADAATRLAGVPATVELRNGRWFDGARGTARTLDLLRDLDLTHVMVDGPQGLESSVPLTAAVTTPALAMLRLHGRRTATWETTGVPTVERYRYLYSAAELAPLMPLIESAAAEATRMIVCFNNCYGNYGATNARELIAGLAR